jgi:hypothetical protein
VSLVRPLPQWRSALDTAPLTGWYTWVPQMRKPRAACVVASSFTLGARGPRMGTSGTGLQVASRMDSYGQEAIASAQVYHQHLCATLNGVCY